MSRALRLGAAACLVALAVVAMLLAGDVRGWRTGLESGDAVYAANPAKASWPPSTRVGALVEDLLGVSGDVRLRRALQLYRETAGIPVRLDNAGDVAPARAQAQKALAAAGRDGDRRRASQALTLLGILAFGAVGQGSDQTQADAALTDFEDAIRADPGDEPAKFDLELLLRSAAAHGVRIGPGVGGSFGPTGRRGAGGGIAGQGY
jgi:hypothetical protein